MRSSIFPPVFPLVVLLLVCAAALPASATVHRRSSAVHRHTVAAHAWRHGRRARLHTETRSPQTALESAPLLRTNFALPPMKGSHESLVRQNERTEADGLLRIEDDAQLEGLRLSRDLVGLPAGSGLRINPEMPSNRRYCRPWTARFLADLARAHAARFHNALQVNSAVRTVEFQRHLLLINGNAAPASGDVASPHLTGAAIDIGKRGLSFSEIAWMRAYLMPLQAAGKIDVEEEFYQSCFHISVYKNYAPLTGSPAVPHVPLRRRHAGATLLAARMR